MIYHAIKILLTLILHVNAEAMMPMESCFESVSQIKPLLIGLIAGIIGTYVYGITKTGNSDADKTKLVIAKVDRSGKYASREHLWPINSDIFRSHMNVLTKLIVNYVHNPQQYNVLTSEKFGFIYDTFPKEMPVKGEKFDTIIQNVYDYVLPGLLHWQHPRFHGYFGAGFSYPDILADTLISGIAVVPYAWIGAPALAELEMIIVNWFGKSIGLEPDLYYANDSKSSTGGGIIVHSSSEAIYTSVMVSRNRKLAEFVNSTDPDRREKEAKILPKLVVYTNAEAHSAIEKACNMAMVRVRAIQPTTSDFGLSFEPLEHAIQKDIKMGNIPFHIHGSLGTTNTAAFDRLDELHGIAKKYNCWFHVDAAYGGCAMICPELRTMAKGLEKVDSLNVNVHKWPFCTSPMTFFWCRHRHHVQATFSVTPAYLKAYSDDLPAFRHWGIQLTRRALCLKAWFVMRMYGLEGMQRQVRQLVDLGHTMRKLIEKDQRFEIVGKPALTLVAFRLKADSMVESNEMTKQLCEHINRSGRLFVTHARPMGIDVVRVNMSHALSLDDDAIESYEILSDLTDEYLQKRTKYSNGTYQADVVTQINGSAVCVTDPIRRNCSTVTCASRPISPQMSKSSSKHFSYPRSSA